MFRKNLKTHETMKGVTAYEGETMEKMVFRILNNKEGIRDGAPLIYTDRKDGVLPEMNIRTDRFDYAIDAMDKVSASFRAKRKGGGDLGKEAKENMEVEKQTETKNSGEPGS